MAQFIVRVYRAKRGYRVVIDGMTDFDVARRDEVEPRARAAIADRIRAYLPARAAPPLDPDVVSTVYFELSVIRCTAPPPWDDSTPPQRIPEPV